MKPNGYPQKVDIKHIIHDPIRSFSNEIGCLAGQIYMRMVGSKKWFKLRKATMSHGRVEAFYKLFILDGFRSCFTIYGEILKDAGVGKISYENNRYIISDPDSFLGAEFSYWGGQFYFRHNNKCDWTQMKKMTISPRRVKALYKLIKEQKKNYKI